MKNLKIFRYINAIGFIPTIDYFVQRYILQRKLIAVRIPYSGHRVYLRNGTTDVNIFKQIFIEKEFAFLKPERFEVVVDCGSNIGLTTIYLKTLFPSCTIFCIEPECENFEMLRRNTCNYENIVYINKALSDDCSGLHLVDNGLGADAFQTLKDIKGSAHSMVQSISIDFLMSSYHLDKIDFVKMDIEGAEAYCINEQAMGWILKTRVLAIEIHDQIYPDTSVKISKILGDDFHYSKSGEYAVYTKREGC